MEDTKERKKGRKMIRKKWEEGDWYFEIWCFRQTLPRWGFCTRHTRMHHGHWLKLNLRTILEMCYLPCSVRVDLDSFCSPLPSPSCSPSIIFMCRYSSINELFHLDLEFTVEFSLALASRETKIFKAIRKKERS